MLRRLPHNIEAEQALLGAIFVYGQKAMDEIDGLTTAHFVHADHRAIFERATELMAAGGTADPITLGPFFANGTLASGPGYLQELAASAVHPKSVAAYAATVKSDAERRELIEIGQRIVDDAYAGKDPAALIEVAKTAMRPLGNVRSSPDFSDCIWSIAACDRDYPVAEQMVESFLTTGLTVISASPKAGKTWLLHELAIAIASGRNALGSLPCMQSEVLCLFLEDSERRCVNRERMLAGHKRGIQGITYALIGSQWDLKRLGQWLELNRACRVVVIDTAERWKQMQQMTETGRGVYADDYKFWGELQQFATSRNIALVVLHHDRKPTGNTTNIIDTVSGTRGITGSADHLWMLDRDKDTGISKWRVMGRDLDESCIEFSRGKDGKLRAVSDAVDSHTEQSDKRARAKAMREDGMSYGDIAKALNIAKSTAEAWVKE